MIEFNLRILTQKNLFNEDYLEYQEFAKKNGEVKREVVSLDELLRYFEENNLPELSPEFIDEIRSRINSRVETRTTGACNSGWINYCGDLNGNGVFSAADIAYFGSTCSTYCNSPSACNDNHGTSNQCETWNLSSKIRRFGYLSLYRGLGETTFIDRDDRNAAIDFVVGLFPC